MTRSRGRTATTWRWAVIVAPLVAAMTAASAAPSPAVAAGTDGHVSLDDVRSGFARRLPSVTPTDLGVPGDASWAFGISESGVVIGSFWYQTEQRGGAFRWMDGTAVPLPDDGLGSAAHDVDVHGRVVATVRTALGWDRPVLWEPDGSLVELASLPGMPAGAVGLEMNDAGDIAFHAYDPAGVLQAGVWRDGRATFLTYDGHETRLGSDEAMNERGEIAGTAVVDGRERAFLWREGVTTELPAPATASTSSHSINARGDVLGWSYDPQGRSGAVLWQGGRMRFVAPGDLDGQSFYALNDVGVAVGQARRVDGPDLPVVAYGTTLRRLPTAGGARGAAYDVGNHGVVVGTVEGPPTAYGAHDRAVAWVLGVPLLLGTDSVRGPVHASSAVAVNERGQVAGQVVVTTDPAGRPFGEAHAVVWNLLPQR